MDGNRCLCPISLKPELLVGRGSKDVSGKRCTRLSVMRAAGAYELFDYRIVPSVECANHLGHRCVCE